MVSMDSLSPEREKEIIDKIANYIVDSGMEASAILFLESVKPIAYFGGQFATLTLGPFLLILGKWGEEAIALLQSRGNAERLLQRIEVLAKEKKDKKVESTPSTIVKKPLLQRIRDFFTMRTS